MLTSLTIVSLLKTRLGRWEGNLKMTSKQKNDYSVVSNVYFLV